MAATDNIYIQQADVAEAIELFYGAISVSESDSRAERLKKIDAIDSLSQFFKQHIKVSTLKDKEHKHRYIRFLSKLTEMREVLELETGKISMQDIELAGQNFAKKTQDPIGVF
jgi:hypothetical protein